MSCLKRLFCCNFKKKHKEEVYVLELEKGKIYVGKSNNVKRRIWLHENNNGSSWTKKYNVIKQLNTITKESPFWELDETLERIRIHGIDNVRGSLFTSCNLLNQDKIMTAKLYCEKYNYCRKCGGKDHFILQCKNTSVEDWVHNFGGMLEFPEDRKCLTCSKCINGIPRNFKYCTQCYFNKDDIQLF